MTPRLTVLSIYPLIIVASIAAIIQCRRLAIAFPSIAWTFKMWLMVGFGFWQVYGLWQAYWWAQPTWWGAVSFSGTLLFLIGLNIFDRLLLQSYAALKKRVAGLLPHELTAGEYPEAHWRDANRTDMEDTIRRVVNPEHLTDES